ncbi:hypothetical protein J437_LFUL010312 [Ladona fulva]|uniref:Uncharacterized protein n=1 Tax=Ladona fulva TaxID=123851 RepID=A0A8K0KH75_LADFU|nr:hypothetical protein J437_LFUL010312 [Ladona fulva]
MNIFLGVPSIQFGSGRDHRRTPGAGGGELQTWNERLACLRRVKERNSRLCNGAFTRKSP